MVSVSGSIGAAGAIGGALISSGGAESAAQTQASAAGDAAAVQQNIYNQTVQNLTPSRLTGQSALYSLASLYGLDTGGSGNTGAGVGTSTPQGNALAQLLGLSGISPTGSSTGAGGANAFTQAYQQFTNSPTYQFALQQGTQALDRSAASSGTLLSGGQLKAAQQYGQGLASQGLGTYTSNLQSLYSGLTGGLSNLANLGENAAATTGQAGSAAAGQIGQSLTNQGTALASGQIGASNALTGGLSNSLAALTGSNSSYGSNSPLAALLGGGGASGGNGGAGNIIQTMGTPSYETFFPNGTPGAS